VNFLDLKQVMGKTRASRPYIYLLISRNAFPRPVKFGSRSAWIETEVEEWMRARVAERDAKGAQHA
jgi:prophage regulatory protein